MKLGEKLARLRRENNYTQEQLAQILGVSRQAVSKWESDTAYPETDKLIRMSELFGCSLDYLLKEGWQAESGAQPEDPRLPFRRIPRERKSEKTLWGMPLWHIAKNARGVIAIGLNAKGVIAVGLNARGLVSLGLFSLGLLSMGFLSLGVISLGLLAIGLASAGCFSIGILTAGAISLGVISLGAIAIGDFSVGALSIGKYFARGDHASAMIALGSTQAEGSVFQKLGTLSAGETAYVKNLLDANVPPFLAWAKELIKCFLN